VPPAFASGVEDYYLDGPGPDGVWIGAGAARLGAAGRVSADGLWCVLDGRHPLTGEPLGRPAAARVPGFDVTFLGAQERERAVRGR
jgi:hypothetical protein